MVFDLRFTEPGGVTVPGAGDRDAAAERDRAHAVLDIGPDGRAWLPGTSLAGALRELAGPGRAAELFGELLTRGDADGTVDARASRVWVLGSRRLDDGDSQFRTSTRINRHRAAAEANTLRTEEVLPAGARFRVFLRWDNASREELEEFGTLLATWRPFLGRGVSRGRGACVVDEVRHGTLRLTEPDDLLRWLTGSGPQLADDVATESVPVRADAAQREPVLEVTISIDGPVRVGSGVEPGEDKVIPLLRVDGKAVLPGAGLKGLLRSRAEFILRSVDVRPPPCQGAPCGVCWPCKVFGHGGGRDEKADSVGQRAMIRVPDATVRGEVRARRTHIAIDRFTGGVLDGALYTMEVLEAGEFTLRVDQFGGDPAVPLEQVRAVLRLVLEDLNDGIIGLGGGVARGYGTVRVRGMGDRSSFLPTVEDARAVLRAMVEQDVAEQDVVEQDMVKQDLVEQGWDGGARDAG